MQRNMEFGDFDDDLFAEERQKVAIDEQYSARFCDPGWFQKDFSEDQISKEDELSLRKYEAEYFFWKKDYKDAVTKYEEALELTKSNNTATHRECYEGLVRCFIKIGENCKAVKYATKLHESSKNDDQRTVSFSVLIEAHLAAGDLSQALTAAQSLVTLHGANSDVWLKLGYVYSCIYGITLPQVETILNNHKIKKTENISTMNCTLGCMCSEVCKNKTKLISNNQNYEKGLKIIASCLYRCTTILKSTHHTAVGFSKDINEKCREKVKADIDALNLSDSMKLAVIPKVKEDVYGPNYISREDIIESQNTDFVDRGSSKFQNDEKDSQVEELLCDFEKKWFC
ncbi:unnamed protein product [Meganyctiphanes norvegica]|uniref:Uncharacterized protein n=1 Tax=Meganyctiphanes norvegica TaxID=48144 RepID=A0AAV2RNS7_MEGNR